LYFNGSSHKNGTGVGNFIRSPLNIRTKFKYKIRDFVSNNEAEYEALVVGLEILLGLGAKNVVIKGDSKLVVKQLTMEYKCISENLLSYFVSASSLLSSFESVSLQHVPRIENQVANDLAHVASGYKISTQKLQALIESKDKLVPIECPSMGLSMEIPVGADKEPDFYNPYSYPEMFDIFEVFAINNLPDNDWRKPIVDYLENLSDTVSRKIKYRSLSYVIVRNELFKKTIEALLLRCHNENEAFGAISNVHGGACGSHQACHKMKWLMFRQGLYWTSMLKDYIEFAKGCQECQKHAGIQHVPASELHSIIKPWPFRG